MAFWSTKIHVGIILVLTFLSYSNIFSNGFLWDDRILIHANQNLHDASKHSLFIRDFWAVDPVNTGSPYHRPLVSMLYILDFYVWGEESPFGWHLTNILLLLIASVIVYFLIRELTGDTRIAFFSALLFGVHPVHTENISWIAGRTDPLMGIFYFLALWMYLRFSSTQKRPYLWSSLLLFSLSLFSKEVAVTLPVIIIFYDWCKGKGIFARWKEYLMFFSIIPLYALVRIWALGSSNYVFTKSILRDVAANGLFDPIMRFLYSVLYYAYLTFWPFALKARHSMPSVYGFSETILIFAAIAFIGIICWRSYKQDRMALFLIGFFIINVLLVSNLFTIKDSFAERFVYLASLSGVVAYPLLARWFEKHLDIRHFASSALVIIICLFMVGTLYRNTFWESPESLFQQEVKVNPYSSQAHYLYGTSLSGVGDQAKAVEQFKIAVQLNPDEYEAQMNLADHYLRIGDIETAHAHAKEMLRINPGDHKSPFYMGHTLGLMGNHEEAEYFLRIALMMKPMSEFYQRAYADILLVQNKTIGSAQST